MNGSGSSLDNLSIRDWFKECGAFTKEDVEVLYKDPDLKLCRDIANALKHMTLKNPGVDSGIQVDRAHMPAGSGLAVFAAGTRHDLVALCRRCYDHIEAFLESHGWSVPMLRLVPELASRTASRCRPRARRQ